MYRYDAPGGRRRRRPPRGKTYCKTCWTLIRTDSSNDSNCESCKLQLPLFPIPDPNGAIQW